MRFDRDAELPPRLANAREFALIGKTLSGVKSAQAGLINRAVPSKRLEGEVPRAAMELASIPLFQLATMKLIVNQACDNMGSLPFRPWVRLLTD
jgi:enoyl-CoA hydratase/carnithine racemase